MVKLNLGCGLEKIDGFVNVDINEEIDPDVIWDISEGLHYWKDESVSYILAKDVLEHIPGNKTILLWNEMYRVLKKGGKLVVRVPLAGSELYWADPEHVTGYNMKTFEELSKPNKLMRYDGCFEIVDCYSENKTQNLVVTLKKI